MALIHPNETAMNLNTSFLFIRRTLPLIVAILIAGCSSSQTDTVWPTDVWPISTPEEQGIASAAIDTLISEIRKGEYGKVDAFMLIRNGYVVADERFSQNYDSLATDYDTTNYQYNYYHPDWHPYFRDTPLHSLQSITKSVTSAALGIAVDRGYLDGPRQLVKSFFESYEPYPANEWRDSTRLEDFLTMRSGIEWKTDVSYESGEHTTEALEASDEWVPFVLSQPMDTIPGTVFEYNDGVSVLLGEIVRQATGTRLDEWTEENLFRAIGIDEYYWKITPNGEVDSEGGLYLATEDLARFGYLILRNGNWNGNQVVSEQWVEKSTNPVVTNIPPDPGEDEVSWGYGYQWWIPDWKNNSVFAITGLGYGGQYLFIVPELDLVMIFNGWNLYGPSNKSTFRAFNESILPAVESIPVSGK